MTKSNKNYTVLREYQCLYDSEELLRRIICHHIRDAYGKKEAAGHTDREEDGDSHGEPKE